MTDYLTKLANKYALDKGTEKPNDGKHHGPRLHFTTIYHKYFNSIRFNKLNILEIGIGSGSSLKLWYEYFPHAKIFAIDTDKHTQSNNDRVTTYVTDQSDRIQLQKTINKINCDLDIIIDDGGHMMRQQQTSFGFLFPFLKSGGLYFIEDLHTSYWEPDKQLYGNKIDINKDKSNTTVKMISDYISTKKISSQFLTEKEIDYLNKYIYEAKLFDLPSTSYGPNKLGLFIKA